MLNDTNNANLRLKQLNEKLSFDNYNTRIMSILMITNTFNDFGSTLLFNNDLYWAGLYASFPNTQYNNKFKFISSFLLAILEEGIIHITKDQFFTKYKLIKY